MLSIGPRRAVPFRMSIESERFPIRLKRTAGLAARR
jgi:hypothetical protein